MYQRRERCYNYIEYYRNITLNDTVNTLKCEYLMMHSLNIIVKRVLSMSVSLMCNTITWLSYYEDTNSKMLSKHLKYESI